MASETEVETNNDLVIALYKALDRCPTKNPGSALDEMYCYKSVGNYDDVAADAAAEKAWDIAEELRPAASKFCKFLIASGYGKEFSKPLPGEFDSLVALLNETGQ